MMWYEPNNRLSGFAMIAVGVVILSLMIGLSFSVLASTQGADLPNHHADKETVFQNSQTQTLQQLSQLGGTVQKVELQGNYAYVAQGTRLVVLDITAPAQPTEVGKTAVLPGRVSDMALAGNYIYVVNYQSVLVIDITTPTNPIKIAEFLLNDAHYVTVANNFAYIVGGNMLRIVNISNPSSPFLEGTYIRQSGDVFSINGGSHVVVQGNLAYVAAGMSRGIVIIDVSDPANPVAVGQYPGRTGVATGAVAVDGNYAYVGLDGVHVVDVTDPANPVQLGVFDPDIPAHPADLIKSGDLVYIALSTFDTWVIDVSNPTSPTQVAKIETGLGSASDLAIQDNHLYIADRDAGLHILDISQTNNPVERTRYEIIGNASELVVRDDYAFVVELGEGVWVVDIADRANPQSLGFFDIGGRPLAVTSSGNYLYIAGGNDGLFVIDISDPTNPTEVAHLPLSGSQWDVAVDGTFAYLANYDEGLHVVDISNPTEPVAVGAFTTASRIDNFLSVEAFGTVAYLLNDEAVLTLLDVSNPASPTEIRTMENVGTPVVWGNHLYLTQLGQFKVMDLTDPRMPTSVGATNLDGFGAGSLSVLDGYAIMSGGSGDFFTGITSSVAVFDVRNVAAPVEIARFPIDWMARGVAGITTGSVTDFFVANQEAGLMGLRLQGMVEHKLYLPVIEK